MDAERWCRRALTFTFGFAVGFGGGAGPDVTCVGGCVGVCVGNWQAMPGCESKPESEFVKESLLAFSASASNAILLGETGLISCPVAF